MVHGPQALLKDFEQMRWVILRAERTARRGKPTEHHLGCIALLKQQVDYSIGELLKEMQLEGIKGIAQHNP